MNTHTHKQYIRLLKLMLHIAKPPKSAIIKPLIFYYILIHSSCAHIQVRPLGVGVYMLVLSVQMPERE